MGTNFHWEGRNKNKRPTFHFQFLKKISHHLCYVHTKRERCRLRNESGTRLPLATLAESLGVNGVIDINIFLPNVYASGNALAWCE